MKFNEQLVTNPKSVHRKRGPANHIEITYTIKI